ncbi:putative metabolite transport protein CsbC [Pedobacter sp. Bi27]|uniref:sugar porter family MFS transporter n=1 Tax=unclassified Pedobacter TaxID=2628915 RepID=UPI001D555CD9|nr:MULTISPECIES: sugar porter family MFS transporter [unclassified Pedobacter]CAH0149159.1 putative metabolite transport protein CsbC [Pedobacter sp. Bi126]CAH0149656.1 putative metabolite transport protein CsbC [Pedobacter sp. Bi27]CAH0209091.1 putative metabolite transport protein CsbC [Pedobacter sp. Bi36]
MKKHSVLAWSMVVALGGFLFGFDTAVISGAEKSIQQFWNLSAFSHGLTISIALIGTVIGSLVGSRPSDYFGRKNTLYFVAAAYLLSSLGTALADNWYIFLAFRFLGGLGVGISSVTAPIYISEVSPAHRRGRLVGLFQFNVVLGILISYLSNYLLSQGGEASWRWMLGVQAFPSIIFLVLIYFIPESPRWLILKRGAYDKALEILRIINPLNCDEELAAIQKSGKDMQRDKSSDGLFSGKYNKPIILAVLFAFFNQVSGINAIIYYAPRIFEMAGLGAHSSLLSTVGIGMVNFIFTLLAINIIDKVGRKTLMLIGSFGLIISLGLVAVAFLSGSSGGFEIPIYVMLFIAFFAFSQGAVIWVFISEIFPNQVRAKGQTLGSSTHWVMAALIAFCFPYLAESFGGANIFFFFCAMMVLQLVFVWKMMPETKGKSLEQIETGIVMH